jgi:hypothetical protein
VISATKGGLQIVDQSGCHLYGEFAGHNFEGFAQLAERLDPSFAE